MNVYTIMIVVRDDVACDGITRTTDLYALPVVRDGIASDIITRTMNVYTIIVV